MLMGSHGENLTFSVDTSSFLSPEADVAFNCEYRQPCLWGLPNKNKTTGVLSAFSSQRPSGVFQPGVLNPSMVDFCAPSLWTLSPRSQVSFRPSAPLRSATLHLGGLNAS